MKGKVIAVVAIAVLAIGACCYSPASPEHPGFDFVASLRGTEAEPVVRAVLNNRHPVWHYVVPDDPRIVEGRIEPELTRIGWKLVERDTDSALYSLSGNWADANRVEIFDLAKTNRKKPGTAVQISLEAPRSLLEQLQGWLAR